MWLVESSSTHHPLPATFRFMLFLFNSLTNKKEIFKPLKAGRVGLYTCGPTVYDYAHIGNLRSYLFEDILKRVLLYNGLRVKHIMNITDIGHLTSDADEGEDKMMKAVRRENKEPTVKALKELADKYTKAFKDNLRELNIIFPDKFTKATDYIKEQIALIKILEEKGFAYDTEEAVYFDISKYKDYARLANLDLSGQKQGAREDVKKDSLKKNPQDFALWFKLAGKNKNHLMNWESPWGKGFPGWHIECSAMSLKHLGKEFDIHCGGIDHLSVHHTNERAQNFGVTGKEAIKFWMHNEHLLIKNIKISKSLGNFYILQELKEKGIDPPVFRYLLLQNHYRSRLNFTWESLEAAQNALEGLRAFVQSVLKAKKSGHREIFEVYRKRFLEAVNDDLNTPEALAILWEVVKNGTISPGDKREIVFEFDKVLGLGLKGIKPVKEVVKTKDQPKKYAKSILETVGFKDTFEFKSIKNPDRAPKKVLDLVWQRDKAKEQKDFKKADELRGKVAEAGYLIEDLPGGYGVKRLRV